MKQPKEKNPEGEQTEQLKEKTPGKEMTPESTPKRGQRQRGKPNFSGQIVMVSQIKENKEARREQSSEF